MTASVVRVDIYPVKGGRGISRTRASVEARGLVGDRRWMVVDSNGRFLTQREMPALARLVGEETADGLTLEHDGSRHHAAIPDGGTRLVVQVWKSTVDAASAGDDTGRYLSQCLGTPVHLVYMDEAATRTASAEWAGDDAPVSFADGFPVLIATRASLDDLNARMAVNGEPALSMERFRPNVVIEGTKAWEDDAWTRIRIGTVVFEINKPCVRCVVTTTDQETGDRPSDEPLRTLATFRRSKDRRAAGVLFGWNAVPRTTGDIAVGDEVEVLETRPIWPVG